MGRAGRVVTIVAGALFAAHALAASAMVQDAQPIVMRLSTATLNDAQHEWTPTPTIGLNPDR
jgi:hypothetical protein